MQSTPCAKCDVLIIYLPIIIVLLYEYMRMCVCVCVCVIYPLLLVYIDIYREMESERAIVAMI